MASLNFADDYQGPVAGALLPKIDFGYEPSDMQMAFYHWLHSGQGSANLIAVAGSGKSTSIRGGLCYIPESAFVTILAFNYKIAGEMKEKIAELGQRMGRDFRRVQAKTFHSLGYGAVLKRLGKSARDPSVEITGGKSRKILKEKLTKEEYKMYGSFCAKLVSLAKGMGLGHSPGALGEPSREAFLDLVAHHDLELELEHEEADMERAVVIAQHLLDHSTTRALKGLLDFDDQIYLPVLWNLSIWQNDFLFIDEAQDTNPCRRALARMALRPNGRLIAVGDPYQAIYGFTGASHDAMDLIAKEFSCVELPLTVSYRCPKAAEELVRNLVPHFTVAPNAPAGAVRHMSVKQGLERLGSKDAVLCRNTAPLVDLAFNLIAEGRGCVILGKDIGARLIELIEKMEAVSTDDLVEKLEKYLKREVAAHLKKGEEEKAEAVSDRVESILRIIAGLKEGERSVGGLTRKLETMFSDQAGGVLTLCTGHKAKGLEWPRVALLEPGLMPSKWARQDHQYQQEKNLMYVVRTRFQDEFIFLDGVDEPASQYPEKPVVPPQKLLEKAKLAGLFKKAETVDDLELPAHLRRNN